MRKNFVSAWFVLCLLVNGGSHLSAFDEFVIEQENEFGGQTTEFSDFNYGILRGVVYYNSDNTKAREEWEYNEKSSELYGIEKSIFYYFSEVKTQEESYYTYLNSNENLVQKKIEIFDKYSGELTKIEKYFARDHLGYNVTFFVKGIRTKVEWYYPSNIEGIGQHNAYFDSLGVTKKKVEYIYTEKTAENEGFLKSVYFLEKGRKIKQIWFFTENYENQNQGVVQQIDHFHYIPLEKTVVQSNFFDRNGMLIRSQ